MTQEKTPVEKEKIRFITEEECDFGFQNCVENKDWENIGDYYESIKQITAKAERDKTAKEIEKLIMKMDMDIACDKARFFESKYIAHYERLLRILKQKYGCKDK